MKILIDNLIFKWQKSGGISVVWNELIKQMLKETRKNLEYNFIEYPGCNLNIFHRLLDLPSDRVLMEQSKMLFKIKRYLPEKINNINEPFIFHSTYYRTCSNKNAVNIVTVHDFTYELYTHGIKKRVHCTSKHYALRKADYIICISQNTKNDLLRFVKGVDKNKIRVIYNGVSDDFYYIEDEHKNEQKKVGKEAFLIFVGNRAPYKNYELAVKIAASTNMKLKIVGGKLNEKEKKFTMSYLNSNFEELGGIKNSELNLLYNQAFALIYPSSYEGFGLPIVEAQKVGCPVLALNNSSIKEIIGDDEQLIPKPDIAMFCEKIEKLKQEDYRKNIIVRGLENSKKYTWDNTYKQYCDLYLEIAENYK